MVLRDAPQGFEVLMLQRLASMEFRRR